MSGEVIFSFFGKLFNVKLNLEHFSNILKNHKEMTKTVNHCFSQPSDVGNKMVMKDVSNFKSKIRFNHVTMIHISVFSKYVLLFII